MEEYPDRQVYCSRSCSASMRAKVLPKVQAADFDALAPRAFYATNTQTAVRLVLVQGKSQTQAANLMGMSVYAVHRATKRFLARMAATITAR